MGTSLQLCIAQRAQRINKSSKMKIFVIAALLAAVSAEPGYGYYGQHSWPAAFGYGHSRICYGCRGKRSADPEPHYGYGGYGHHYGGGASYVGRTVWGLGKRSADAEPEADAEADPHYYGLGYYGLGYGLGLYGPGVAGHPGAATSFVARSTQGIGKRSADAEPHYYGLGGYYGYGLGLYGPGIAGHPGAATSFVARSTQGIGKRSAD